MRIKPSILAVLVLAPRVALACPVCFGQSDSPLASAINLGVIVMLGVIVTVLAGFASFIFHLNRRARLAVEPSGSTPSVDQGETGTYLPSNPQEGTARC